MSPHIFITDSDFSTNDKTFEYLLWFQPTFWWIVLNDSNIYILLDSRYFWNKDKIDLKNVKDKTKVHNVEFIEFDKWWEWLLKKIIEICSDDKILVLEDNIAVKYYKYIEHNSWKFIEINENFFWEQRLIKQKKWNWKYRKSYRNNW